jgi:hypothetical protein
VEELSDADKAIVRAQLAKFTSAWDAYTTHQDKGFAKVSLSHNGRVYSLQYRGIEVALLVRRHSSVIELTGVETAPAVVLKSEEDEWVLIDLLQAQDALVEHTLTKALSTAQVEIKQLQATLAQQNSILEMKGALLNSLENAVQDYKDRDAKRAKRAAAAKFAAAAPSPVKAKATRKVATKAVPSTSKAKPKSKPVAPAKSKAKSAKGKKR